MGQVFHSLTDSCSPAKEEFLTFPAVLLCLSPHQVQYMMSPVSDPVLRILSREESIMDERRQKEREQQRTLTNVVKISPQMSSLGKKSYSYPLGHVSYTLHFTGRTFWMVNTHGTKPPKDGERGRMREG